MTGSHERPDADALLRKLEREETAATRGRLRIYLGAAPGVGKTYAMLHEGKRRAQRGTDVVVGFAETYGRPLTVDALTGLEVIPRRKVDYRGVTLEEMDVEALIARHPQVALVDELAHTNAPGSKHEKRWQDVQDIQAAGITVISTLNIQHLESLNDVVAGITGIHVRETVPDSIIDDADEIELVDVSAQALRSRMQHGNIYPPEQAQRALDGFFRESNLTALRELVLRRVADQVEHELDEYMHEHALDSWEATERVLVLLDNIEGSEVAVRRAWRLASAFDGELFVAYPAASIRQQGMTRMLEVATDLNATVREIPGDHPAAELGDLIRTQKVSHLVLVANPRRTLLGLRRKDLVDDMLEQTPNVSIHLVSQAS
ncbi:MAG: sensor histidine kinase KdpD [Dehalococcoidia bacterium]|nr:sensor histidine kinase KdpD [Dehalococcoidia bacterium]